MFLNYIKIALRNIHRNKAHSFINIMGLAIGIACAVLLLLAIREFLSYDSHYLKHDRIYMVQSDFDRVNSHFFTLGTSSVVGPTLKDEYPAIEEFVRNFPAGRLFFRDKKGEAVVENEICYADPSIFKIFDHDFIYGSPEGSLDSPRSIVINSSLSKKYFGEQNPVGKILTTTRGDNYTVKGVFKDLPRNTIRYYSAIIPMMDYAKIVGFDEFNSRESCRFYNCNFSFFTYILLNENADITSIKNDYKRFRKKYLSECIENFGSDLTFIFERVAKVFRNLKMSQDSSASNYDVIFILSILALLILTIACINYMNLSTAKSAGRAREVGVRKVLGAERSSLIRQFLCESIIITILAFLIALVLIELCIPSFNELFELNVTFGILAEPEVFLLMLIIVLFVGILSGSYPALFLSSFLPASIFRGSKKTRKGTFRKLLIIIQFTLSLIVIDSAFLIKDQMEFWNNTDMGFNDNMVLMIQADEDDVKKAVPFFKNEISGRSDISYVSRSLSTIWSGSWNMAVKAESPESELIDINMAYSYVDTDFADLMEMTLLEGRFFSREIKTDEEQAIIVNEAFVKAAGWKDSPVGKIVQNGNRKWKIAGLLKDFSFEGLYSDIRPVGLFLMKKDDTERSRVTFIKLRTEDTRNTLEAIKAEWEKLIPGYPFEYRFLEEAVADKYKFFDIGMQIFSNASILCIFVACLGLFGLSSFMAEKRIKEIGIRKIHGASVWNIFVHMAVDFLKLVIISGFAATVFSYFSSVELFRKMALKNEINYFQVYFASLCMVLAIDLLTVAYHSVKAALTDPVKALRYE